MGFDWNDLKTFLAVARGGSTLAAAKALKINQTTVARRLEALEADVGLKLFERGQSGSRLTEAGEDLVAEAERLEEAAASFDNRAAGHRRGLAGVLRVTATEILANLVVTPSLPEFRRRHPDIRVDLVVSDLPLDLEAGEADVAIRAGVALTVSDLVARKFAEFDFAFYASRDYVRRRGLPGSVEDLRHHDLITGEGARLMLPGVAWMLERLPGVEPVARCNSMTNLLHTLKAGVGIAPFGCLVADVDPELVRVLPPIPDLKPGAWVVTRSDMTDVPRVRAFSDFIVPFFATLRKELEARGAAVQAAVAAEIGAARAHPGR
jgi:DNA-binding transcriptional LysR family regulator